MHSHINGSIEPKYLSINSRFSFSWGIYHKLNTIIKNIKFLINTHKKHQTSIKNRNHSKNRVKRHIIGQNNGWRARPNERFPKRNDGWPFTKVTPIIVVQNAKNSIFSLVAPPDLQFGFQRTPYAQQTIILQSYNT